MTMHLCGGRELRRVRAIVAVRLDKEKAPTSTARAFPIAPTSCVVRGGGIAMTMRGCGYSFQGVAIQALPCTR
jgi:hypothetical protein